MLPLKFTIKYYEIASDWWGYT